MVPAIGGGYALDTHTMGAGPAYPGLRAPIGRCLPHAARTSGDLSSAMGDDEWEANYTTYRAVCYVQVNGVFGGRFSDFNALVSVTSVPCTLFDAHTGDELAVGVGAPLGRG